MKEKEKEERTKEKAASAEKGNMKRRRLGKAKTRDQEAESEEDQEPKIESKVSAVRRSNTFAGKNAGGRLSLKDNEGDKRARVRQLYKSKGKDADPERVSEEEEDYSEAEQVAHAQHRLGTRKTMKGNAFQPLTDGRR